MLVWLAVTLFGSSLALFSRLAPCSWRLTGGDCCGRVGCIVLGSSALLLLLLALALYAVIVSVEGDTEVPVPRRTTRSQSARLNLAATLEGFVPANNPNTWRDRDLK